MDVTSNLEFVIRKTYISFAFLAANKKIAFLFFPTKILILPKQTMKITASLLKDRSGIRFIGGN